MGAARTIANQGVVLIATAHGTGLTHLVHNPALSPLIGGVDSAIIGDLRWSPTRDGLTPYSWGQQQQQLEQLGGSSLSIRFVGV